MVVIPQYRVREVGSPGECGCVTLCTNLGRTVLGGLWTCDPRCRFGDWGCMTPGAGSGSGCHHGDCGPVTPGIGSGRGSPWRPWMCEPGNGITLGIADRLPQVHGVGKSPCRPWMCDPRCQVREVCHPANCGHVTPDTGLEVDLSRRLLMCDPR